MRSLKTINTRIVSLYVLLAVLAPVLWIQNRSVRRQTPLLPEALGPRYGQSGNGPIIKILIAGDSGAAGVGVQSQEQGLGGQIARQLGDHWTVQWELLAVSGLDSPGLAQLLSKAVTAKFDVVILSVGVNDATALLSPNKWLQWQHQLAQLAQERFHPRLLVHSAMPPMRGLTALPQPLRWFMGCWTTQMNGCLERWLVDDCTRVMTAPFQGDIDPCLATDGFHPSEHGYNVWASEFSRKIKSGLTNISS